MALPINPTIPGYTPQEGDNCRVLVIKGHPHENPPVLDLPALLVADQSQSVISRWELSPEERLFAFLRGEVYLRTHTFGHQFQPVSVSFEVPEFERGGPEAQDQKPQGTGMERALLDILQERERQNSKWGEQNHGNPIWSVILGEETGEVAQAILHDVFGGSHKGTLRAELVQVAAVALQWIKCLDRQEETLAFWSYPLEKAEREIKAFITPETSRRPRSDVFSDRLNDVFEEAFNNERQSHQ